MMYPIRLKTGFFETTACTLSIRNEGVMLTSPDGKHSNIRISRDNIIAVTITMKRYPRFEIHTCEKTYSGVFFDEVEQRELEREFRECLGSKVFTERE